jgi:hypothetical protein
VLAYFVPELVPTLLMTAVLGLSLRRQITVRYYTERLSAYGRLSSNKDLSEPLATRDIDDDDIVVAAACTSACGYYYYYDGDGTAINSPRE